MPGPARFLRPPVFVQDRGDIAQRAIMPYPYRFMVQAEYPPQFPETGDMTAADRMNQRPAKT